LILGVFVVTLSIFYIWSRVQIVQIGYEINEYKKEQVNLEDENKKLSMEYTLMKSPKRITEFAQTKLNMKLPDIKNIIEVE
jgi:cell division protein FtsL